MEQWFPNECDNDIDPRMPKAWVGSISLHTSEGIIVPRFTSFSISIKAFGDLVILVENWKPKFISRFWGELFFSGHFERKPKSASALFLSQLFSRGQQTRPYSAFGIAAIPNLFWKKTEKHVRKHQNILTKPWFCDGWQLQDVKDFCRFWSNFRSKLKKCIFLKKSSNH